MNNKNHIRRSEWTGGCGFSFGISYFDSGRFSVAKSVITFFSVS